MDGQGKTETLGRRYEDVVRNSHLPSPYLLDGAPLMFESEPRRVDNVLPEIVSQKKLE